MSLAAQALATLMCASLIREAAKVYRWPWLALCLGLFLMTLRRANQCLDIYHGSSVNLIDAYLSLPISILLFGGVIGLNRLLSARKLHIDLLTKLAAHDPLTGALSRTEIFYRINEEIKRAERYDHTFAVLEFDIDHFKAINDQYGHHVGDEILAGLVGLCKATLRSADLIGRIGGEEFVVLLPETNFAKAQEIADRLRLKIANTEQQTSAPVPIKVTVSIGVALVEPSKNRETSASALLQELINEADHAMYQAKQYGRNRIAVCQHTCV